jgi:hypothetical protein
MGSLPDQVYLDELPKLRAYPNIRTLGYVATNYADKPIDEVLAEIGMYAKWPKLSNDTKMRVDGIFLDETPSTYNAEEYEYLKVASQAVRNGTTFKDRFVGRYSTLSIKGLYFRSHFYSAKPGPNTNDNSQLASRIPRVVPQSHRYHSRLRRSLRSMAR